MTPSRLQSVLWILYAVCAFASFLAVSAVLLLIAGLVGQSVGAEWAGWLKLHVLFAGKTIGEVSLVAAALIVIRTVALSIWLRSRVRGPLDPGQWIAQTVEHFVPIWRRIAEYRRRDRQEAALARGAGSRFCVEVSLDVLLFAVAPTVFAMNLLESDVELISLVSGVVTLFGTPLVAFAAAGLDMRDLWRTRPGARFPSGVEAFE